jgi:hypothetical protein
MRFTVCLGLLVSIIVMQPACGSAQTSSNTLQPLSVFASIADPAERSRAIFTEAAKVLTHPRCLNCHPMGDSPTQANDVHPHEPFTRRDLPCVTCYTDRNFTLHEGASYQSIPGHPRWMMAPIEMAWQGKSIGDICRQIKDPTRDGGRDLALLHDHLAKDDLVAWGWQPGVGREPAPGNQELLGELIQAWIDTGAQCP